MLTIGPGPVYVALERTKTLCKIHRSTTGDRLVSALHDRQAAALGGSPCRPLDADNGVGEGLQFQNVLRGSQGWNRQPHWLLPINEYATAISLGVQAAAIAM